VAPIVSVIDIARPQDEVFSYVTDPSRFVEWQDGVVSGHTEGDAPAAVGTRCIMTRRIGGSERTMASEITEISPPRTWAIRGIDGPVRAAVKVTVEPRRDDQQSHVTISVDFTGHGFGKMLVPVVVRQAQKEVPESCLKLRQRLEGTRTY
jgi:uncharacterized protein YndB with AHSA1/START domain